MGIAERRVREREALRTRIIEAARDILSERGLDGLSMRSIAERIEYSPGTIYLYFRDKSELVGEVIRAGFERMGEYMEEEVSAVGLEASPMEHHRAMGRAYAKFALENTAYFRVMFELPTVPNAGCMDDGETGCPGGTNPGLVGEIIQRATDEGFYEGDMESWTLVAWGVIHGLTSLYLSGHLAHRIVEHEEFLRMVERSMDLLGHGMRPRETQRGSRS